MSFVAPLLRTALHQAGKYVYRGLLAQDRIIDYTYRRTGLYNRGVVRGIKHGLAGGAVVGGTLQLGLNAPDTPGNDVIQTPKRTRYPSSSPYKTRRRQTTRFDPKCPSRRRSYPRTGRSRARKYY